MWKALDKHYSGAWWILIKPDANLIMNYVLNSSSAVVFAEFVPVTGYRDRLYGDPTSAADFRRESPKTGRQI